jgi:hypothetical protein
MSAIVQGTIASPDSSTLSSWANQVTDDISLFVDTMQADQLKENRPCAVVGIDS